MDSENTVNSGDSRVLRPAVNRWLKVFRQSKDQPDGIASVANVVSLFSSRLRNTAAPGGTSHDIDQHESHLVHADSAVRVSELQRQLSDVETACGELIVQCESFERSVDRAQEICDLARARLSTAGESVPSTDTAGVSTLQASYLNFAMVLKLQQNKRDRADRKLARMQSRHACLWAEVLALSDDPRSAEDHDFRRAA